MIGFKQAGLPSEREEAAPGRPGLGERLLGWVRGVHPAARFLLPLALALAGLAFAVVPLFETLTVRWFVRDLDMRSQLVARTLAEPIADLIQRDDTARLTQLFDRTVRDERLFAAAFCNPDGRLKARTSTFPATVRCRAPEDGDGDLRSVIRLPTGGVHVASFPVATEEAQLGYLLLVHDMSFVERRSADGKRWLIALIALLGVVVSLVTLAVAWLSWRGWLAGMRALLRGELAPGGRGSALAGASPAPRAGPELQPLMGDLRRLFDALDAERRDEPGTGLPAVAGARAWTPDRLRLLLREMLHGDEIIVVSNREPYLHQKRGDAIVVQRPASGLVTAVEPVMRACSGTWVAHGSGSADRDASDPAGRVAVPPEAPAYTLRRIWLSEEEERGYYYGFANEGLWPLCHNAHVRPVFRDTDWAMYRAVNERFADAVASEAKTRDPVVLVQDYHFALLPRMIRERLPAATILTFWHIPWPNPEAFGICPWKEELLDGLLGSTIVGFHTRSHGRNFIEAVDRSLESRIEHEQWLITHGGHTTLVQDYPISIHWPDEADRAQWKPIAQCRADLRSRLGVPPDHRVALGVDRLDYTKGIVERFLAVESLLEREPHWVGRFTLVQIAAPSRSSLDEYRQFDAKVRETAQRINARFAPQGGAEPIALLVEHHDAGSVFEHYRGADLCVVTSLHDGMNLVAKEFVAARDDERGVLVLSQFAGAADELRDALIVNPYWIEEVGDALARALSMSEEEQRVRMSSLRALVRDFNVYRWAGRMLIDAARVRQRRRVERRIERHGTATRIG